MTLPGTGCAPHGRDISWFDPVISRPCVRPAAATPSHSHLLPFRFQIWHFATDRRVLCTQGQAKSDAARSSSIIVSRNGAQGGRGEMSGVASVLVRCCYGNTKEWLNTAERRVLLMALSRSAFMHLGRSHRPTRYHQPHTDYSKSDGSPVNWIMANST